MLENVNMEKLNDTNIANHNEAYTNVAIPDGINHRLLDSDIVNSTINIVTEIEDSEEVPHVSQGRYGYKCLPR